MKILKKFQLDKIVRLLKSKFWDRISIYEIPNQPINKIVKIITIFLKIFIFGFPFFSFPFVIILYTIFYKLSTTFQKLFL